MISTKYILYTYLTAILRGIKVVFDNTFQSEILLHSSYFLPSVAAGGVCLQNLIWFCDDQSIPDTAKRFWIYAKTLTTAIFCTKPITSFSKSPSKAALTTPQPSLCSVTRTISPSFPVWAFLFSVYVL